MQAAVAETSADSSRVEMLITTTRDRSQVPGEMFTGERARAPAFADITVFIPAVPKVGDVAWPKKLPANPATDFATLKADKLTKDGTKAWLSTSVRKSPNRSVLVFIHGFNNRFEDSVYRFAQIVELADARSASADGHPQRTPTGKFQERNARSPRRRRRHVPLADRGHGRPAPAVHPLRIAN